jgi:Na+/H+-dicarboxylate symporter
MAACRPCGDGSGDSGDAMTVVGRAIGLFVLCVMVGLFLESVGITVHGIFYDTWHTIASLYHKVRHLVVWSLPYALLGAVIVVPLTVLSLVGRWRRRR